MDANVEYKGVIDVTSHKLITKQSKYYICHELPRHGDTISNILLNFREEFNTIELSIAGIIVWRQSNCMTLKRLYIPGIYNLLPLGHHTIELLIYFNDAPLLNDQFNIEYSCIYHRYDKQRRSQLASYTLSDVIYNCNSFKNSKRQPCPDGGLTTTSSNFVVSDVSIKDIIPSNPCCFSANKTMSLSTSMQEAGT